MPPKLLQSLTPTVLPHQQTPRKGDEQAIRWQTPAGNKGTFVIKALSAAGLSAGVLDNGSHFCTVVLTGAGVKEEHRTGAVKHSLSPTFIAEPMAWSVHHRASTVTFTVWCTNDKKELSVGEFALPLSGLEDGAGVLDEALVSTGKCRPSVNATGRILCMYDYVRPPVNALLPITPDAVREGTFGKLHMRILKCEGLLATSGSSNPFVRVTCCGRYTKFLETSKQYRTINPYFDEWLGFDIQERHFNVRVEVFACDPLKLVNDLSLGWIWFTIPDCNRVLHMGAWELQTNPCNRSRRMATGVIHYEYIVQYRPDLEWSTAFTADVESLRRYDLAEVQQTRGVYPKTFAFLDRIKQFTRDVRALWASIREVISWKKPLKSAFYFFLLLWCCQTLTLFQFFFSGLLYVFAYRWYVQGGRPVKRTAVSEEDGDIHQETERMQGILAWTTHRSYLLVNWIDSMYDLFNWSNPLKTRR